MIEKQHIIKSSSELFKKNGIKNSTMDDIASAMGISKKTLYQTISDRNELIEAVIMNEYYGLEKTFNKIVTASTNSIDQLIKINVTVLEFLRQINPTSVVELQKAYSEVHREAKAKFSNLFVENLKTNLTHGQANGLYKRDIDIDVIIGIHSDRIESMQASNRLYEAKQSAPETIKQMITYYIRGLVTSKGEEILNKHIIEFDKYIE